MLKDIIPSEFLAFLGTLLPRQSPQATAKYLAQWNADDPTDSPVDVIQFENKKPANHYVLDRLQFELERDGLVIYKFGSFHAGSGAQTWIDEDELLTNLVDNKYITQYDQDAYKQFKVANTSKPQPIDPFDL